MQIIQAEQGFLALPSKAAASYEEANTIIIPFGLEASVSFKGGASQGPQAMIAASYEVELFDEDLWCEPYQSFKLATLQEPKIKTNLKEALNQLEDITQTVLDDGKFPFIFGGEHSITAGSIRPFAEKYDDLVILHFDAHADLRDGYNGEHYSHAAALRRCLDYEHIELVSVGIRNISAEEIPYYEANKKRIHIYWAKDIANWDIEQICSHLKGRPVYLTFDIDGFDSSLIPATGTPEPGGLFWNDAITIIKRAAQVCHIVGADINELAPKENLHACDFLAAKLAYKILSYKWKK